MIEGISLSIIVEQVVGFYFLIMGFSFLTYKQHWVRIIGKILKTEDALMACGMKELLLGLTIVSLHNAWSYSYAVIVTVIAWGMIIEGSLILLTPRLYIKVTPYFYKKSMITMLGLIMLLISGIILLNIQHVIMI